jgi:hypothetical protein
MHPPFVVAECRSPRLFHRCAHEHNHFVPHVREFFLAYDERQRLPNHEGISLSRSAKLFLLGGVMEADSEDAKSTTEERRLRAVLALLRGEPAAQVCRQYHLCRSALYKYRH